MPENERYDAIVFYSSVDQALAAEVVRQLRSEKAKIWFAPDSLPLGKPNQQGITEALTRSAYALVCIGASGLGPYQTREFSAVANLAAKDKITVIPVYLPGAPKNQDDPFLADLASIDLRAGATQNPSLNRLLVTIKRKRRRADSTVAELAARPGPHVSPPADQGAAIRNEIVKSLLSTLGITGLTVFVGASWPESHEHRVPNWQEIAVDILRELNIIPDGPPAVPDSERWMSVDLAAYLRGLYAGDFETEAQRIMEDIPMWSLGEPSAYAELVDLLGQVCSSPRIGVATAVAVSTNVDNGLERAFLQARVPFTRIVYNRESGDFWRVDFRSMEENPGKPIGLAPLDRFTERSSADLSGGDLTRYREIHARVCQFIGWEAFVRVAELNRLVREYDDYTRRERASDNSAHGEPTETTAPFDLPVLVKLFGAYDVVSSGVVSTPHYYQLARNAKNLPKPIQAAITQNAALFLGYNMTEPAFIQLYEACLRDRFAEQLRPRWALIQVPDAARNGQDRIDLAVLSNLASVRPQNGLGITPVLQAAPSTLLRELREGLVRKGLDSRGTWF